MPVETKVPVVRYARDMRTRRCLLLLPALLAAPALWIGLPACTTVPERLEAQTPASCADCHRDIARQWRASAHASAWRAPAFVRESESRTKAACLGCHAPKPLFEEADGRPALRAHRRSDGVDCAACHKDVCAQVGPYDGGAPHGTREDAAIRSSAFCGRCHEMELREHETLYATSVAAPERKSCAECHMTRRTDRLTQGHVLSAMHPRRVVADHSFRAWKTNARTALVASPLRVERGDGSVRVVVRLTNVGAGHRVPTGEYGYRELRIRVVGLDDGGAELGRAETSLLSRLEDGLEPNKGRDFELDVDVEGDVASVRLLVERINEDETLRLVLIDRRHDLP